MEKLFNLDERPEITEAIYIEMKQTKVSKIFNSN